MATNNIEEIFGEVLIVEDTPASLTLLTEVMNSAGHTVRQAQNGEIALISLHAKVPDLILLDIQMPGMDGFEVCLRLKADPATANVPVIFLSAFQDVETKVRCFQVGAVDYISKPYQIKEVLARVKTHLELARARKALAATNAQLLLLMEQLVQAEKLRSIGFLAAGIAHELNTPVGNALLTADVIDTIVRDFTNAQTSGSPEPDIHELLTTCREGATLILRNLNRASKLIGSLKEVAVDRASERRRRINLRDMVTDVVAIMHGMISKTPYSVLVDIDPDLSLETYPGHLEQILDNLIQNSIIHGFDGAAAGTIRISGHRSAEGGIALMVADDGKGIAPENINQVFDPFFTTRLGQGGSGLGLNIVYSLATGILGGRIQVTSELGKGAQFMLTLPLIAPLSTGESTAMHSAD